MKLIIDIDDETYKKIKNAKPLEWDCPIESVYKAIKNGTPLEDIKKKLVNKVENLPIYVFREFDNTFVDYNEVLKIIKEYKNDLQSHIKVHEGE